MKEEFVIQKIIEATSEVFETMLFMAIEPGDPVTMPQLAEPVECTAFVAVSGEINGALGLHTRRGLVESITSTLADSESESVLIDAWAEVANMVAGNLKTHISSQVDTFELSVPTVIFGQEMKIVNRGAKSSFPRMIIPFIADDEYSFYVDALLHFR